MSKKSFAALYAKLEPTPAYQTEKLSVAFLAELNALMQTHAISNAELARRAGVSPGHVTKLFRGSSNLSTQILRFASPLPETIAAMIEAREMTAARYGSAKELFDALDEKTGIGKARASAKKV